MKKVVSIIFLITIILSLCSCHAVPPETSGTSPVTTPSTMPTVPATAPTTVPTEPAMPKELVSEKRDDIILYNPEPKYVMDIMFNLSFDMDKNLYPDMTVTFDVSVEFGEIYDWWDPTGVKYYKQYTVPNPHFYIQWYHKYLPYADRLHLGEAAFVDIVIRADGHIIGYGVIEFGTDEDYIAMMRVDTVCFPMIDGELQEVSEEYVAEKIAELKQTVTPFNLEEKQAEYDAWYEYMMAQRETTPSEP